MIETTHRPLHGEALRGFDRTVLAAEERGRRVERSRHRPDEDAYIECSCGNDDNPSVHLSDNGEGRALIYDFHCERSEAEVLADLGLGLADLYDDRREVTYRYEDGRVVHRRPGKKFSQSGNTKGRALFRADRVREAVRARATIFVVEGEADVHAVERAGAVATCSAGGARKWKNADYTVLYGAAEVVVVQDRDDAGREHAEQVVETLRPHVGNLRVVEASEGKDAADHLIRGFGLADLVPVAVPGRWARITWASAIKPEPVVWGWSRASENRIPASALTLAAGREGTGKSSFGIWLAAKISRGTLDGSFRGRPRRVFYCAVEDSWQHTIVPRLIAADADLSMIGRFDVVSSGQEVTLSLPHDNAMLQREAMEHDVALIVVDPLLSAIGQGIETHNEREVRTALDPLAMMARNTGCVVLGIAHFNKSSGTDLANLITGSGGFKNVARAVLAFGRDDEGGVMTQAKNSLGRLDLASLSYELSGVEIPTEAGTAETSRFEFIGETDRTVRDVLRDSKADPEDADERSELLAWLTDYLKDAGGEAKAKDVIDAGREAGYPEDRIKKARRRTKATSTRIGFGKDAHYVWALPMDAMDAGDRAPGTHGTHEASIGEDDPDQCRECGDPLTVYQAETTGLCAKCKRNQKEN